MIQLGISAFYHDSAAALVIDGKVVFAIEEEKLSGIKHDNSFPLKAIEACLSYAQITIDEVDIICWYEIPKLKYTDNGSYITDFFVDLNVEFTQKNIKEFDSRGRMEKGRKGTGKRKIG